MKQFYLQKIVHGKRVRFWQELIGGWDDTEGMLANLANVKVREQICEYIHQAKLLDGKALDVLKSL